MMLQCQRFASERWVLRQLTSTTNFQQLTSNHQAAAVLAPWFLRLGLLSQFSWARDQLPPCLTARQSLSLFYSLSVGWRPPRGRRGGFYPRCR